jgi:3-hydroxybutyrate dehydrogenase
MPRAASALNISNEEAKRQCCWAIKSLRCNSPRPKSWARWRCFSALPPANNVRGAAWNMDGGWVAQ